MEKKARDLKDAEEVVGVSQLAVAEEHHAAQVAYNETAKIERS